MELNMSLIKQMHVMDIQALPSNIKTKMFSVYSDCRPNNSYFYLDLDEYRNWIAEPQTYAEYYSQNQADVMHWLCEQTQEPELLMLFWW
jgi:hypothetical protein